jgi:mannosyl-oligosaccharide alpha-1,2-mannosidase
MAHGYYITGADYVQRPEVLESNFYAWRVTGDQLYLDRARSAVTSFNKYLSAKTGFAGIYDVDSIVSAKIDETESFWFAEVLKYLYVVSPSLRLVDLAQATFTRSQISHF